MSPILQKKKIDEMLNHCPKIPKLVISKPGLKKSRLENQVFLMVLGEVSRNSHKAKFNVGIHHIPSKDGIP